MLYFQTAGTSFSGHKGHAIGTLEHGEEADDSDATPYEKEGLIGHPIDLSIFNVRFAPLPFLRKI